MNNNISGDSMQYNNRQIDNIIILEDSNKELLANKIMQLGNDYTIIDIQYATIPLSSYYIKYSALILLTNKY